MQKKKVDKNVNLEKKITGFHKRWNIEMSEDYAWNVFKNRLLNSYASILKNEFIYEENCDEEFMSLIGVHDSQTKHEKLKLSMTGKDIEDCPSYKFFINETDIKKILLGIEAISWMESIQLEKKNRFFADIKSIIRITNVPIELIQTGNEFLIYPSGAKLLDEKLVNDNLDWLEDYPEIYETFKKSLSELGIKGKERQVIDNLRLVFELLLKKKLNNSKSMENQKSELGKYLKSKGISIEISNLYWIVLDYYSKYQNNNIKHSDNANPNEVEFILYLTGTLMRLFLVKDK
jgi:hypothetical protein